MVTGTIGRFDNAFDIKGLGRKLLSGVALDMYGRQGNPAAGSWVAEHLECNVDVARRGLAAWHDMGLLRCDATIPGAEARERARKGYQPSDSQVLHWMGRVALASLRGVPQPPAGAWQPLEWALMLAMTARQGPAPADHYARLIRHPANRVTGLLELWAAVDVVEVRFARRPGVAPLRGYRCAPNGRRWMSEQIVLVRAQRGELTPATEL